MTLVVIFMILKKSLFVSSVLKGAASPFFIIRYRKFTLTNIKILPKLKVYNNYSHQIAFEMEETQVKIFV
jgi:hypothetical protein